MITSFKRGSSLASLQYICNEVTPLAGKKTVASNPFAIFFGRVVCWRENCLDRDSFISSKSKIEVNDFTRQFLYYFHSTSYAACAFS